MAVKSEKLNVAFHALNVFVVAMLAGIIVWVSGQEASVVQLWLEEGSIIENATVVLYAVVIVLFFALLSLRLPWYLPLILGAMQLRELDFHKRFTTMSISKSRFFLSGEVPLYEKLIGGAIWVALIYFGIRLVRDYFKPGLAAVRNGRSYAWSGVVCVISVVVGKSLDGVTRKLGVFGIELETENRMFWEGIEEVLEMGIPIFMMLSLLAYYFIINAKAAESNE